MGSKPTPEPGSAPRILRMELIPRRPVRVRLHLDRGEPLEVAYDVAASLGLHVGRVLHPKIRKTIEQDQEKWVVRQAAFNLLSHRPRTVNELRTRLRKKGHTPALVEWCLHHLQENGLLDDRAFAEAFARTRIRLNPRGRRRLIQELRKKGVTPEIANQAVTRAFATTETDESRLGATAALSWLARQPPAVRSGFAMPFGSSERERSRRRLLGFLARRGFDPSVIRGALESVHRTAADA